MQQVKNDGFRVLARDLASEIPLADLAAVSGGMSCQPVYKITYANGMYDLEVTQQCDF